MKNYIYLISLTVLMSGCSSSQVKTFFMGMDAFPYGEPVTGKTANLTVSAPQLKSIMGLDGKLSAFLYDACTTESKISEGYIGSIVLSSNPKIGKTKTVTIKADTPIFLEIGSFGDYQCTAKFRWKPEENADYSFIYSYKPGFCNAIGYKIGTNGKKSEISDLEAFRNKDGFFSGSGSTSPEWRECSG